MIRKYILLPGKIMACLLYTSHSGVKTFIASRVSLSFIPNTISDAFVDANNELFDLGIKLSETLEAVSYTHLQDFHLEIKLHRCMRC